MGSVTYIDYIETVNHFGAEMQTIIQLLTFYWNIALESWRTKQQSAVISSYSHNLSYNENKIKAQTNS